MKEEIRRYLYSVARNAIAQELGMDVERVSRPDDVILDEKRGVFVTLELEGKLRGCIGNIMPVYPLEEAVQRNAANAAFDDPRFEPLNVGEFSDLGIEISVLTVPEKLEYSDVDDLLSKLEVGVDGVVLERGSHSATYLPQVWDEVKDKETFLSSLCMKAGMPPEEWKKGEIEVSTYKVEKF
jgi:uncharacterized protein